MFLKPKFLFLILNIIKEINGKHRLMKILRAYSNLDPEVGYTQGMNYIAAALLVCLNPENDKKLVKGIYYFT